MFPSHLLLHHLYGRSSFRNLCSSILTVTLPAPTWFLITSQSTWSLSETSASGQKDDVCCEMSISDDPNERAAECGVTVALLHLFTKSKW